MSDHHDDGAEPRRRIQWVILVCALVFGSLALVDCGSRHPTTTAQAARSGVITYLQAIANSMHAGTKLVSQHPLYKNASLRLRGGPLPASERGGDPDAPYTLSARLWVQPASGEGMRGAATYRELLRSWRAQGLHVDSKAGDLASKDMPDGFTLVASVGGEDSMTVAVQSPRFPQRELDRTEPLRWPTLLVSDGSRFHAQQPR